MICLEIPSRIFFPLQLAFRAPELVKRGRKGKVQRKMDLKNGRDQLIIYKRSNSHVGHHSPLLFNSNATSRLPHMGNILEDLVLGNIHLMQRHPTVQGDTTYPSVLDPSEALTVLHM